MAKMFYTKEEVLKKLGKTEDQVNELIKDGKLREFWDDKKLMFKVDEVDDLAVDDLDLTPVDDLSLDGSASAIGLAGDTGSQIGLSSMDSGSQLGLTPEQDLNLPGEDMSLETGSVIGLASNETGSVIGLAPGDTADQVNLDEQSDLSKDKDDTVVTSHGGEALGAGSETGSAIVSDPLAGSDIAEPDFADELNLDGGSSGSGLLDLSREADDTSLGAELLDEIYPEPSEDLSEPKPSRLEVETTTGTGAETAMTEEPSVLSAVGSATDGGAVVTTSRAVRMYDDTSGVFGAALIVPFVMLIYAILVAVSGALDIQPELIQTVNGKIWYVTGGAGVLTLMVLVIGLAIVNRTPQPAGAKKAKKAKAPKEKKSRKSRK